MNIAKCLGKAFYIEPQPAFTCSKLTLETTEQVVKYLVLERPQWRRSGIFIVNFEHILYLVLVFLFIT